MHAIVYLTLACRRIKVAVSMYLHIIVYVRFLYLILHRQWLSWSVFKMEWGEGGGQEVNCRQIFLIHLLNHDLIKYFKLIAHCN